MLSFEERELARRFHELGARIVVPEAPRRRPASIAPLVAAIAALVVIVIVLVAIIRPDDTSNTASPTSPSPRPSPTASASSSVIASSTPLHRATPYGQLPPQILPSPGTTAYTITGMITQLGPDGQQHPINGARIDVFVTSPNGSGYHWMSDETGATGVYQLWGIPRGSTATLYAVTTDPVTHAGTSLQPCAYQFGMFDDEYVDIEIVPMSAGGAAATAAARRGARLHPNDQISGQVFERQSDGTRSAVPNAMVWVGGDMEPVTATTITDTDGNYLICGIKNVRHEFTATASGFTGSKALVTSDANGITIDFEMSR